MNPILERKMKDLIDEAKRQGSPAIYTVMRLLYSSCLKGAQNSFAQHCCRITPIGPIKVSITNPERPEEWLTELNLEAYEERPTDTDPRGTAN